jgi:hypothetical protein
MNATKLGPNLVFTSAQPALALPAYGQKRGPSRTSPDRASPYPDYALDRTCRALTSVSVEGARKTYQYTDKLSRRFHKHQL